MRNRLGLVALASTLALLACDREAATDPVAVRPIEVKKASLVAPASVNLPIQFPTGLAFDGEYLWLSTGSGWRYTYKIDTLTLAVVDSIKTNGNPRDVVFINPDTLFVSDMDSVVRKQAIGGGFGGSLALPFRGGGIASDGNRLYVADIDANRMIVMLRDGTLIASFKLPVRAEGMVLDQQSQRLWVISPFDSKIYELVTVGWLVRVCDSPFNPGPYGLGGIAMVGSNFVIAEPQGGNPFAGTTLRVLDSTTLVCSPPLP